MWPRCKRCGSRQWERTGVVREKPRLIMFQCIPCGRVILMDDELDPEGDPLFTV